MIRFFASHPTAANLLMLIIVVLGFTALPSIQRATFPDFEAPYVQVRVAYPGASAESVEEAICQRIESALDGISFVDEIRSDSVEGSGSVTIEMQEGEDLQQFLDDITNEVDMIDDFPEEALEPVIIRFDEGGAVVSIAVTGPMSTVDLKAYCEQLKDKLIGLGPVSLVSLGGFSDHQIRIETRATTLMEYGLSVQDIAALIDRQNVDLPSGTIKTEDRDILVRFADERRSPREFEDLIIISGPTGAEVRLGDIATVSDVFELDEEKTTFNGRRAGILNVRKTKNQDTLRVYDTVTAFIEGERLTVPPGVEFELTSDFSSMVRDRLNMLVDNGLQGLVLVLIVLGVFFSFRYSFWVTAGMPVAFFGAFFFMPLMDQSLNMITLIGLLLGLGLVLDDAIVIAENVAAHLERGSTPLQAAIEGTAQVRPPIIIAFLTTICIFAPITMMQGQIGRVLRVMPIVLILVLAVSLIEAFLILPHHLAGSLARRQKAGEGRLRLKFNALIERIRTAVNDRLVIPALKWRYGVVGIAMMAFLISLSVVAGGMLKFQAFPNLDSDTLQARLLLPPGTPLKQTEAAIGQITDALEQVNLELSPLEVDQQELIQNVAVRYSRDLESRESGAHVATVTADLIRGEVRRARIDEILARWSRETGEIPDVISLKFSDPVIGPSGHAIEVRLQGQDLGELKAASLEIQEWLGDFAGVNDLSDDMRPGKPELRLRLREGATALGLDAQTIASQLRAALFGQTIREIQVGDESLEINVQLADEDQDSLADLDFLHITLPDGQQVPLESVVHIAADRTSSRITRIEGRRTLLIEGDVDTRLGNTDEIVSRLIAEFTPRLKEKYDRVTLELAGETKESAVTTNSLRNGFLIGLVGIYVLLSYQFRSYLEPLIVMSVIPMAFIGLVIGHLIMGINLSLPSMFGFVSLSGVVVNDSILLVEFIKLRRREGKSIKHAAQMASRERFRAVLLTSLTTAAGLLPLLAERNLQAQILIPLVTSIVFGLLAATVLVLLIVPALYLILADLGLVRDS